MGKLEKMPHYEKRHAPIPLFDVGFMDELELAWRRPWGAQTHTGRLEMALVHRPGPENEASELTEDPAFVNLPEGVPDHAVLQKEHDAFVAVLEREGVEVVYLDPEPPLVGTYGIALRALVYARTGTVIAGGAIIDRNANHYKRGMERFYARRLLELGCPILFTVHGMGCFESSDLIFVDPTCAILASSCRTNQEGIRQVTWVLEQNGVKEFLHTDLPSTWRAKREQQRGGFSGYFHLDGAFGMAAENVAVVSATGLSYHLLEKLHKRGIDLVEAPPAEVSNLACNLLVLGPGKVLMPAGNPVTAAALRGKGITVHEVEMTGLVKAGGGPKCITMPLIQR